MAIVPLYYVVADAYDVDPSTKDIKEGMLVALTAAGVRRVDTGDKAKVLGLAGDTKSTASAMPGVSAGWQNRASDAFDETRASGKMTVYHSGGVFAIDQFVDTDMDDAKIGHYLIANETYGTLAYGGAAAHALAGAGTPAVAMLLTAAGPYPSGVPGTDVNNDIALGGDNNNQYITIKLLV